MMSDTISVKKRAKAEEDSVNAVSSASLRELAYEKIKHLIVTCELKPGEYLNEAIISKVLGIGRTPVHQALDQLSLEHMVEIIPRKGVIVRPISLQEVMRIIEVRLLNEPYCASLAAQRADASDIASLTSVLDRVEATAKNRDVEAMMVADRDFHTALARAAGNDVLGDILRKLHERSLRLWFISLSDRSHHLAVDDEHRQILEAIKAGDADRAGKVMKAHIESFRENIMKYL